MMIFMKQKMMKKVKKKMIIEPDHYISPHIKISEIACPCCRQWKMTKEIRNLFESIRAECSLVLGHDCPIHITSGYRCKAHNAAVGGEEHSQHMEGTALDILCPEPLNFEWFYHLCYRLNPEGGVGVYFKKQFVHIDCRGVKKRWLN